MLGRPLPLGQTEPLGSDCEDTPLVSGLDISTKKSEYWKVQGVIER